MSAETEMEFLNRKLEGIKKTMRELYVAEWKKHKEMQSLMVEVIKIAGNRGGEKFQAQIKEIWDANAAHIEALDKLIYAYS